VTQDEIEKFGIMMRDFKAQYPDFAGPITPSESVVMQRKVIESLTIENSGAFLSHHGNKSWL